MLKWADVGNDQKKIQQMKKKQQLKKIVRKSETANKRLAFRIKMLDTPIILSLKYSNTNRIYFI